VSGIKVVAGDTSQPSRARRVLRSLLGGFNLWVGLISGLIGIIATIWASTTLLFSSGELDLVVWVQEQTVLYPSDETDNIALPFEYSGEAATSAAIARINISNLGSHFIGTQEQLWQLEIRSETQSKISLLGEIRVTPERVFAAVQKQSSANKALINIGILEPGDSIELTVLIVNANNPRSIELQFVPSLQGLPKITQTRSSLQGRITERLLPVIALILFLLFAISSIVEFRSKRAGFDSIGDGAFTITKRSCLVLALSAFYAVVVSTCVGWIIARMILFRV
jgi:hypothetical protein